MECADTHLASWLHMPKHFKEFEMGPNGQRRTDLSTLFAFLFLLSAANASSVRLLHSEVEAFQLRLDLIEQSQSTIDLSSYEISDDNTSGRILNAILSAAERGVTVRVMVDGHVGSNRMPKPLMQFLIDRGVAIRERPMDVRYQLELGRPRLHDKLLIVDRSRLIIGSRNQVEVHFGIGSKKRLDRDVYIEGQSACKASDYFQQRWNDPKNGQPDLVRAEAPKMLKRQIHPEWNTMPRTQALEQIKDWLASQTSGPLPAQDVCGSGIRYEELNIDECNVRFLHDYVCESKTVSGAIAPSLHALIRQSRHSIELESPYLAISKELKTILLDSAHRGVKIRILTNSLLTTDQVPAHAGFVNERRWMLNAGIKIHELHGPNMLHAKSMVIDGRIAMVGSYNFDMLSEKRNSEVAIVVTDCSFANQVLSSMDAHRLQSTEIHRGNLFRYEAKQNNVTKDELHRFQRLRLVAPLIERYL